MTGIFVLGDMAAFLRKEYIFALLFLMGISFLRAEIEVSGSPSLGGG